MIASNQSRPPQQNICIMFSTQRPDVQYHTLMEKSGVVVFLPFCEDLALKTKYLMEFAQEPSGADRLSGIMLRQCKAHKGMSAAPEIA